MNTPIDDGGPAFPQPSFMTEQGDCLAYNQDGTSLREWFAGQALAGLSTQGYHTWPSLVGDAYAVADEMIKRRAANCNKKRMNTPESPELLRIIQAIGPCDNKPIQRINDLYNVNTVCSWAMNQLNILEDMAKDKGLPDWYWGQLSAIRLGMETVTSLEQKRKANELEQRYRHEHPNKEKKVETSNTDTTEELFKNIEESNHLITKLKRGENIYTSPASSDKRINAIKYLEAQGMVKPLRTLNPEIAQWVKGPKFPK